MCPQEKFGGYWVTEWDFMGSRNSPKIKKMLKKELFWDPPKIPLSDPITPKFLLWAHFDPNSTIFYFESISISYKTKK